LRQDARRLEAFWRLEFPDRAAYESDPTRLPAVREAVIQRSPISVFDPGPVESGSILSTDGQYPSYPGQLYAAHY
jgi:hypothetical protein